MPRRPDLRGSVIRTPPRLSGMGGARTGIGAARKRALAAPSARQYLYFCTSKAGKVRTNMSVLTAQAGDWRAVLMACAPAAYVSIRQHTSSS
jgi:hypothetical protein